MNIRILGNPVLTGQIDRIHKGFQRLGVSVNDESKKYDFVYCNDPNTWREGLMISLADNVPLICNVLDIPTHLNHAYSKLCAQIIEYNKLNRVKIVCISKFVQSQIHRYCRIENVPVIFQPIKDIKRDPIHHGNRTYKYLIVGRNADPNKKHRQITIEAIKELDGNFDNLYSVGEDIGVGHYLGQVSDDELQHVYLNSKYLFFPSEIEGLGLPPIEAILSGCIPIMYHWNLTAYEFFSSDLIFDSVSAIVKYVNNIEERSEPLPTVKDTLIVDPIVFTPEYVADSITNIFHVTFSA